MAGRTRQSDLAGRTLRIANPLTGQGDVFTHVVVDDDAVTQWQQERWFAVAAGHQNRPPDECSAGQFRWIMRPSDGELVAGFSPIVEGGGRHICLYVQPFWTWDTPDIFAGSPPDKGWLQEDGVVRAPCAAVASLELLGRRYRACYAASVGTETRDAPTERMFARRKDALEWLGSQLDRYPGKEDRALVAGEMWVRQMRAAP